MKTLILAFCLSFFLTMILGKILLPKLKKLKVNQPILHYVKEHSGKTGTPTMGGIFFLIPITITFIVLSGEMSKSAILAIVIMLGYGLVGFLDDYIKIRYADNKGLSVYQKVFFQLAIAIMCGFFVYYNGQTFLLPFIGKQISLGVFTIPIIAIVFLATTNGVNLTDGLDGLCAGTTFFYCLIFAMLLGFAGEQFLFSGNSFKYSEYGYLILLAVTTSGGLLAYLQFNASKAKVFMGDTGSLSLGAVCAVLGVFSKYMFFIPLVGIVYLISCLSVILQVLYFKRTKKRIFLMAPYHHHLQIKGKTETQIMFIYIAITIITSLITMYYVV